MKKIDKDRAHVSISITASARAKEFPNELHADGGKLFCSTCNIVLDHCRKSTVKDHLSKSAKHLEKKKQAGSATKKQNVNHNEVN